MTKTSQKLITLSLFSLMLLGLQTQASAQEFNKPKWESILRNVLTTPQQTQPQQNETQQNQADPSQTSGSSTQESAAQSAPENKDAQIEALQTENAELKEKLEVLRNFELRELQRRLKELSNREAEIERHIQHLSKEKAAVSQHIQYLEDQLPEQAATPEETDETQTENVQ